MHLKYIKIFFKKLDFKQLGTSQRQFILRIWIIVSKRAQASNFIFCLNQLDLTIVQNNLKVFIKLRICNDISLVFANSGERSQKKKLFIKIFRLLFFSLGFAMIEAHVYKLLASFVCEIVSLCLNLTKIFVIVLNKYAVNSWWMLVYVN